MWSVECGVRSVECGVRSENTALRSCLKFPQIQAFAILTPHSSLLTPHSSLLLQFPLQSYDDFPIPQIAYCGYLPYHEYGILAFFSIYTLFI